MAKCYTLTADVFTIPYHDDESILYAPLLGFVCVVNDDVINLLADVEHIDLKTLNKEEKATLRYLEDKGLLNGSREYNCVHPYQEKYQPAQLTLFPTNQCNLRCIYCYASAGEQKPLVMDWHYAVSAIEFMITSLKERGGKHLSLGLHGGGEPLYPWQFIKRVVGYVEDRCSQEGLTHAIFSASNGVLSEKQLQYIVKHFVNLNISFDGLPHVQDYHRPLAGGQGSFEHVDRTMRFLDEKKFNYGIRGTVSDYNINLMPEIVRYIGEHYRCKSVHLEPLFYCGRCKTTGTMDPGIEAFAEQFKRCEDVAAEYGINLIYSGCHIDMLRNMFCGVSCANFSVTPDGYLTACYEVTDREDSKSEKFFFGRIREDGTIFIDDEKRRRLHSLTVDQLDYCRDCFAKWHCAGECAAKIPHDDITGARGHDRCQLNRQLIAERLKRIVEGNFKTGRLSYHKIEDMT
ncbi:radical SAM protein [candidate division KSB1 bacterium]|nr:radical SAM protein [candidate division KSB1 bacterium]